MSKIHIKGIDITVSQNNGEEYINLTEIVKSEPDGEQLIKRWLSNIEHNKIPPSLGEAKKWSEF